MLREASSKIDKFKFQHKIYVLHEVYIILFGYEIGVLKCIVPLPSIFSRQAPQHCSCPKVVHTSTVVR